MVKPERIGARRVSPPKVILAVSSLGVFMAFVDATIVEIAFPDIRASFPETDISSLSWVLNAYNIVLAAFLVAAGSFADLVGRRRIFLAGIVIFTTASGLCAIAGTSGELTVFRILQGIGAALMVPSSLGLVLQAFPPDRKAHAVALLSAVAALAAGIGPTLGGLLIALDSWRLVFLVNLPVGIASFFLARRYLAESRSPGRRLMPDLIGTFAFAIAISMLVLGVVKGEEWGWTSGRVLGSWAIAAVLFAFVIWRCTWHRSPIVDLALFRIRTFAVANAMTVVTAVGFYGYTLANVLFLTGVWQYSVLEAGLAITPGAFAAAAVAGPTSAAAERYGHRPVLVTGGLVWGAAVFWLVTQVGVTPNFLSEWLPGVILLGIGAGTLLPNISGAAIASAPGNSFATATALNSVARQVGASLGLAVSIAIIGTPTPLEAPQHFDNAWTFAGIALLAAGIGCLGVGRIRSGGLTTPSLGEAARYVFSDEDAAPLKPAPLPVRPVPIAVADVKVGRAESPAEFLLRAPIFAALTVPEREEVAEHATDVQIGAGEWLFHEGDEADSLYVIRSGRLDVIAEGRDAVIRVLGRGAVLGELALLTRSQRSASVRAARDSSLLRIDRDRFEELLDASPAISRELNRVLGEQLASTAVDLGQPREVPVTIAVVGLDRAAPAAELARSLHAALGDAELIDDSVTPAVSGDADPVGMFAPIVDRAEMAAGQVVLVASSLGEDPWSSFCLQQADRILAVSTGGEPSAAVPPALAGCDLVAVGVEPASGKLAGVVSELRPEGMHAIPGAEPGPDVHRLARRLLGRSVGIVLSGGGARALSQIGVLRELEAAGIQIDRVGGVDLGAYIGALYAMGLDLDEIDARCYDEWVRRRPLGDYTLPRHSLIRGDRVRSALLRSFGDVAIEELPRSFYSVSTDLRSGDMVVGRTGLLRDAVGRSIAIPVLGPPVPDGERLLATGSLVDHLPIAPMADSGEGPCIAVDVRSGEALESGADGDDAVPGLAETLMSVLALRGATRGDQAVADWTVAPQCEGVGLLEFHQIDEAIGAGQSAAREALGRVPASLFETAA